MVGTRIEARVENVERKILKLGVEMGTIRECLVEMQTWIRKDEEEVRRGERDRSTKALRTSGAIND